MVNINQIGVIGYITKDIIKKEFYGTVEEKVGGKSYYCGLALANLGVPTVVFNKVGEDDLDLLDNLRHRNIELVNFISDRTPVFENVFVDRNLEDRFYRLRNDKFIYTANILKNNISRLKGCRFVHLAPGKNNEIPLESVRYLKENLKSTKISIDAEHLLFDDSGGISVPFRNPDLSDMMKNLDILQISEKSVPNIVNCLDIKDCTNLCSVALSLSRYGPDIVIITRGSKGSLICSGGDVCEIKSYDIKDIVDTTGAGDTHISCFLHGMIIHGGDVKLAGDHAAYLTARKIENGGPLPAGDYSSSFSRKMT